MREKDRKFVNEVATYLWSQRNINANREEGLARVGGNDIDYINPTLVLTKIDIKERTGRKKLRDVVIDELQAAFEDKDYLVVSQETNGNLTLTTKSFDKKDNTFTLKQLQESVKRGGDLTHYPG